jgi:hypothetical protein
MDKGHPRERQKIAFIDMWTLFGGCLFQFINEGLSKCGLYSHDCLYSGMIFNTGLSVVFCCFQEMPPFLKVALRFYK